MKKEESIFGAEPDRLMRLMRTGLEADEAEEESGIVETAPETTPEGKPGTRIGRYKLLRELGEGGMGIVYLAEQQGSIRRRVALKVVKPGMDSKRVLARFDAERQALALLDHPNIAHVYDAGMTDTGRPYFVMEHVKGLPVTKHCDHYKLTITERLRLFQQVCQAVQHAHQKGIIHRDIKPSNILVTIHEDQAILKIIDFGVAKAVLQPLTDRTLYTEQGQLFGTPEYMSPEQADMASEDIDTRSDIYSLGVLLYELLTGVLPFDSETLHGGGIDQIRKVICETDPKTPSTRLTRLGEEANKVAENRRTEIGTLAKHLRKELEWIPLKAMRKERPERYRSASELADDIENYLKGAPLMAGPLTAGYRLKKFLRRHKALVGGIAAVLLVSVIGIIVSVTFALGQARALTEAETVCDLLQNDLIDSVNPERSRGHELTITSFLEVVSESVDAKLRDMPMREASIHDTLGRTYRMLGRYKEAEQHRARAYHIRQEQLGDKHIETSKSLTDLAQIYGDRGRYEEAKQIYATQNSRNGVALMLMALGRYEEAEKLWLEMLQTKPHSQEQWFDPDVRPFITGNLGELYIYQGRYDEAEKLLLRTLKDGTSRWDEESPYTLVYMSRLGAVYRAQDRHKEAEYLLLETLEIIKRVWGKREWHYATLYCRSELAQLYADQGRYDETEPLCVEVLDTAREMLGNQHCYTLTFINRLAALYSVQGRYTDAEALFKEAVETGRQKFGDNHPNILESMNGLAVLYKEQGNYNKAEPLLLEALNGRRLKLGDTHPHTLESLNNLIALYEAWNKPEKVNEWRTQRPIDLRYQMHIPRRRGHDALGTRGRDARDTKANPRRVKLKQVEAKKK